MGTLFRFNRISCKFYFNFNFPVSSHIKNTKTKIFEKLKNLKIQYVNMLRDSKTKAEQEKFVAPDYSFYLSKFSRFDDTMWRKFSPKVCFPFFSCQIFFSFFSFFVSYEVLCIPIDLFCYFF